MKLAFSQFTSADGADVLMRRFAEFGYDGLQLKGAQYGPFLDDPQAFLAKYGDRSGVASALITGGQLDEPGIASLRQTISFAAAVGSKRVVFCHGKARDQVKGGDHRLYAKILSALGQEAQDQDIALSLHHHFNQPVMHRDDFAPFFDAADAGRVGLTIDTAHLIKSGVEDVAGVIHEWAHVIDNFHLKDIEDGQFKVLGQGRIDFAPIFDAIRSIGYGGWVSADEESGADVVEAMRTCHDFMTRGLGHATPAAKGNGGIVRATNVPVHATDWGSLQWICSKLSGPSRTMTFGRVTIQPGQANPIHLHPNCEELLYVVRGQVEHTLPDGRTAVLEAGDAIVIPPNTWHQARSVGQTEAEVLVAFGNADRKTVMRSNGLA